MSREAGEAGYDNEYFEQSSVGGDVDSYGSRRDQVSAL